MIREQEDVSVLLIEQNVEKAINNSNRIFLLKTGKINENNNTGLSTLEWIEQSYFENK